MFLIFQSIGTQELIIIGIVALMFLGPRKLPEYARKIGKMMHEMRNAANEFKTTWEREVDFEQEARSLEIGGIEKEADRPVARLNTIREWDAEIMAEPEVREIDPSIVEDRRIESSDAGTEPDENIHPDEMDKRSWL